MKGQIPELQSKLKGLDVLLKDASQICDDLRRKHVKGGEDGFFEINGIRRSLAAASRTLEQAQRIFRQYESLQQERGK